MDLDSISVLASDVYKSVVKKVPLLFISQILSSGFEFLRGIQKCVWKNFLKIKFDFKNFNKYKFVEG